MLHLFSFFFFNDTATTEIYTLSLHDALPISADQRVDDDLDEVSAERADRLVGLAGAVEDRPGVVGLSDGRTAGQQYDRCDKPSDRPTVRPSDSHALTDAGSATRRPITSAMTRTSRISCANWSGNSDCAPSARA